MDLSAQAPTRELRLAPHVHACQSDGQVILLDLRRDKYVGVGGAHVSALAGAVEGWPKGALVENESVVQEDIARLARRLLRQGLLIDKPAECTRLPDASVSEVVTSLGAEDAAPDARVSPRRLFRFLRSAATAAAALRCLSLWSVVHSAAKRRARCGTATECLPLDAVLEAVAAYEKLRPLVFTSRDQCLFDSLALINFLAYEGLFPRWVIGVKTRPFGAHSWVQSGDVVLNDLHERVRKFRPILVI